MTEHSPESLRERLKADGVPHTEEQDYYWQVAEDAIAAYEHVLDKLTSHAPDGHNVTNQQYVNQTIRADLLQEERDRLRGALKLMLTHAAREVPTHIAQEAERALEDNDPEGGDAP